MVYKGEKNFNPKENENYQKYQEKRKELLDEEGMAKEVYTGTEGRGDPTRPAVSAHSSRLEDSVSITIECLDFIRSNPSQKRSEHLEAMPCRYETGEESWLHKN